ncbi:DMT family transporter [Fluviibacterium sp. DFM31]|uniref:DMT family transporter n=1 Tax=Meridianimarinicoccus marinus TaxID=3231483 RepID=A0ABV3L2H9_9RHOB
MTRLAAAHHPLTAAAMVLTAMATMGLIDNYVRVIAETTGLWQFHVIRSSMCLALLAIYARLTGAQLRPRRWRPVVARSAIMSVALVTYFGALVLLPISEVIAGLFTAPIWVLLLSAMFFGKSLGRVRIVAVLAGFIGVMLVLRPDTGSLTWLTVLPLLSGVLYALAQIATREWCAGETALTLLFAFFAALGLWGLVGLAGLSLFPQPVPEGAVGFPWRLWGQMSAAAWVWTVAQALGSMFAVGLIIRAYQSAEASFVAVFEYALLIFAVFWGYVLLGQTVDGWALTGIAVIVGSGAVMVLRDRGAATATPPAPAMPEAATGPEAR